MDSTPGDADLVRTAQRGDVTGFGILLERHRADMRAVAVSLLGWGPDAEDAVQDAMLVALRRLSGLRDPAAAGPWLKAITRNAARMRLRAAARHEPFAEQATDLPSREPSPAEVLESHALRDWVWSALETLSEPLQTVVLLRYFTSATSYEQIAAACGVPVGTVRSRLNQARRKLTGALRESAAAEHDDTATRTARRRRTAHDLITSAPRGEFRQALSDLAVPDMLLIGPQGQRARGPDSLVHIMDRDLQAGVRQRLTQVTAARRVTILECDLLSPPWDPLHCPPGVLWLMKLRGERIEQIRLFHPVRPAAAPVC